jgi:hypothetical protein
MNDNEPITEISTTNTELILIPKERLIALEILEQSIPTLIEKAMNDYKKAKLKMLHDKDKLNPAGVNARVKRYNERNKDKINERRLMKRNQRNITSIIIPVQNDSTIQNEFTVTF